MHTRLFSFARNTVLTTVLLAGVYGLREVAPLGTVLLVFDPMLVTAILGQSYPDAYEQTALIAVLFLLGLVGTAGAHLVHRWRTDGRHTGWLLSVAGALSIVGLLWILWTIPMFGATHTDSDPVVITAVSGLILLGLAGWIAGSRTRKGTADI